MDSFNIIVHRDLKHPKRIRCEFVGSLDEDVQLDPSLLTGVEVAEIDFNKLTRMNSIGIREWIQWISSAPSVNYIFSFCPKFFIQQANSMAGFIPPKAKFRSFYVPYFNEDSGNERDFLFSDGRDYHWDKLHRLDHVSIPDSIKDGAGGIFSLDVDKKRYLKFLFASVNNHEG